MYLKTIQVYILRCKYISFHCSDLGFGGWVTVNLTIVWNFTICTQKWTALLTLLTVLHTNGQRHDSAGVSRDKPSIITKVTWWEYFC